MYVDKLDDIVKKYNNTYRSTIKMKLADVKANTYIKPRKYINDKDHKFKFDDHVMVSKYKNIFVNGYDPYWSEDLFVIKKFKNAITLTYIISDLNGEEIV